MPIQVTYYVDDPNDLNPGVTGGYVRHRDRMIQESVFEDLKDTLITCRWMAGTTARPVRHPTTGVWGLVTTAADQTLGMLDSTPINLIDYFPEAEGSSVAGDPASGKTPDNTLALDNGTRIESEPREMGNRTAETVLYRFSMAFFAASDGMAQALLGDLADRYRGRAVRDDIVELWNYNDLSATLPVVRMSVESFQFTSAADQEVAPVELKLYFAELMLEDEVD